MKRILVLSEHHPNKLGSMEEFYIFIAREIKRRGDQCFFGFPQAPSEMVKKFIIEAGGVIAESLYSRTNERKIGSFKKIFSLVKFIRENKIELIHINFYCLTNPYLLACYFSGAKIVFTEHTSGSAPSRSWLKKIISNFTHIFLHLRVTRYVAISHFVRERIKITHRVTTPQSVTIHNGVNHLRFLPSESQSARIRTGLPVSGSMILAVAQLIPEKGLQHLIEAFALLKKRPSDLNSFLVIAGEGPFQEELSKRANAHGLEKNVHFLGRRSDVSDLVAASQIVAVPSVWNEGFGLIVAEAMASGRPVIASRVGGIPELIENGVSGILVEPADTAALAEGLVQVLEKPDYAIFLAHNALKKSWQKFDVNHQVTAYADLFDLVLKTIPHNNLPTIKSCQVRSLKPMNELF